MKAYAFVFAKTHGANRRRKSSPLANRDRENFYFAFVGGDRPPLLLQFLHPARNPPLPSHPYFSLIFLNFFFSTSPINKTIKESKTSKKEKKTALT
jgi:hypothetical protein